jgi:hypothetical protein
VSWDRLLWGVEFTGGMPDDPPMLLGKAWSRMHTMNAGLPGEPTRALLFNTRKQARAWCAGRNTEWSERTDSCRKWRVRAVRVRETVRKA